PDEQPEQTHREQPADHADESDPQRNWEIASDQNGLDHVVDDVDEDAPAEHKDGPAGIALTPHPRCYGYADEEHAELHRAQHQREEGQENGGRCARDAVAQPEQKGLDQRRTDDALGYGMHGALDDQDQKRAVGRSELMQQANEEGFDLG